MVALSVIPKIATPAPLATPAQNLFGERMDALEQVRGYCDSIKAETVLLPDRARAKLEATTDSIECLFASHFEPIAPFDWTPYGLSAMQSRIADYLRRNVGKCRTKDQLVSVVYHDREPSLKSVDVMICQMRKKLIRYNCPYWIETVWGHGYRMVERSQSSGAVALSAESFAALEALKAA